MNSLIARRLRWLGWFLAGILAMLLSSGSLSEQQSMTSASSSNSINQFMAIRLAQPVQSIPAAGELGVQIKAGC